MEFPQFLLEGQCLRAPDYLSDRVCGGRKACGARRCEDDVCQLQQQPGGSRVWDHDCPGDGGGGGGGGGGVHVCAGWGGNAGLLARVLSLTALQLLF